jgi:hypothetical protein
MTATNGTVEAIAAGDEMRARVLRLLRAEAVDGFS